MSNKNTKFKVIISSFGYKAGSPPQANIVFDVRFLKNPYWIPELRHMTGLDQPVKDYVLNQPAANEFLNSLSSLISIVIPQFIECDISELTIALGCTGGQHRSAALVETLASKLKSNLSNIIVECYHRELSKALS